jgi:predicted pyridoxine 5'-phosphate oxidase superfamily flavin-nucleotide-binding protein
VARFHAGELAVQTRAGVADRAAALEDAFETEIPAVAAEFLAAQPWIVLGAADADDRMWATILYGHPGFVTTPSPSTVHVAAQPLPGDPLSGALTGAVGGLALEPGTRRRMRLNGQAWSTGDGVSIELEQVYSNCPKYIATRHVVGLLRPAVVRHAGDSLDAAATDLLARADTAFVATRGPDGGVDASHRGGNPGFLRVVDEHTVLWPDYTGNSMFNTLGNIAVDPATGLTVVDPVSGTTLYLSGRAEVLWEDGGFPGAQRLVRLTVDSAVRLDDAAPLSWELERPARNPPVSRPPTA